MKKNIKVLLSLLSVLVLIILTFLFSRAGPKRMLVELSGTPGLRVEGTYVADGVAFDFSGVLPTEFEVQAKHLKYTIEMKEEGVLQGRLVVNGKVIGLSRTPEPFGGVAGEYYVGSSLIHVNRKSGVWTVSKQEDL